MGLHPWYAPRGAVIRALDAADAWQSNAQVDDALNAATERINGDMHRVFWPTVATRYFDWPNYQYAQAYRLWLEEHTLVAIDSLTVGGSLVPSSAYQLEPNTGPPYTRIEMRLGATQGSFSSGPDGHQRSVAVAGTFGYQNDTRPAGTLAEALDTVETDVDVSDGSLADVGNLLVAGTERMIVTERTWLDSTQTLGGDGVTASKADQVADVANGSAFHRGELLLLGAEQALISEVAGNTLVLQRAYNGTVLAAHPLGTAVFVSRRLTVERGSLGTTVATHASSDPLVRWEPPALIRTLCVAEAMSTFEQEQAGYARTVGEGENTMEASGKGLKDLRAGAWATYCRRGRKTAI